MVEMHYLELTPAELRRRVDERQAQASHTTWHMSGEELARWSASIDIPTPGELDGSEPIDNPPAGFATWDEWRRHRSPAALSWHPCSSPRCHDRSIGRPTGGTGAELPQIPRAVSVLSGCGG